MSILQAMALHENNLMITDLIQSVVLTLSYPKANDSNANSFPKDG
jgi:hypothetical protein